MLEGLCQFFIGVKIPRTINERINRMAGTTGLGRSTILRLALIDFLTGSNSKRRELERQERLHNKSGSKIWIREEF